MTRAAIRSIGVALPELVRTNDHWSPEIVERWMEGRRKAAARPTPPPSTPAAAKVRAAMAEVASDPFCGSVQRHNHPRDQLPSALEAQAAQEALDRAGVRADSIDFVLEYTTCPDFLVHPNACLVHEALGLRTDCLSLSTDGVCNAFQLQLHLAGQLLASGRYRRGLLVQNTLFSWVNQHEAPFAPWCGDAATAQVVEASQTHGVLADVQITMSELARGVVVGTPGAHWSQGGPIHAYLHDREHNRQMLEGVADQAVAVVHPALERAGLRPADVDFYASHQATIWFRRVTQEVLGLKNARSVDTFASAASVGACNLPLVLATAERDGLLKPGDRVALYSGGSGVTVSGAVLRWGFE